jgi:hypothetical protein
MLLKIAWELPPHIAMVKPADTSKPARLTATSNPFRWIKRSSRITAMAKPAKLNSGIKSPRFKIYSLFYPLNKPIMGEIPSLIISVKIAG